MNLTIPGTDIQLGKWYHATQIPPQLTNHLGKDKYRLLLGIKGLGMIPGHYSESRKAYEWDCQRYEGAPRPGWISRQAINNNLEWVLELARGVSCWMVIPDFDNKIPSIDGLTGFDTDHHEDYGHEKANLDHEEKQLDQFSDELFRQLHLN